MKAADSFAGKVAWVRRRLPDVDDPRAFVAAALREAGHDPHTGERLRKGGVGMFGAVAREWGVVDGLPADNPAMTVPHSRSRVHVGAPPKRQRKRYPYQGTIDFQGLRIRVENRRGSYRAGVDDDGHRWRVRMHAHYGEIEGTEGTDGDALDCYVGPNHDSPLVVIVHQRIPGTSHFDEDKALLGFNSESEALALYDRQYDRPGFRYEGPGGHTVMTWGQFLRWCRGRHNRGRKIPARRRTQGGPLQ